MLRAAIIAKVTSKEMHDTLNTLSLTTVDEAGYLKCINMESFGLPVISLLLGLVCRIVRLVFISVRLVSDQCSLVVICVRLVFLSHWCSLEFISVRLVSDNPTSVLLVFISVHQ